MKSIAKTRIEKELKMFSISATPGISCTCNENSLQNLMGVIIGAPDTPFENGIFNLSIQIPERYPFEPPCVRFVTPIYHPNIDSTGRICLDTLKLPPQGTWKPHLNLSTVLMMIRVLMGEPGTEDPLMTDIWHEYKYDYPTYAENARQWTTRHARSKTLSSYQASKKIATTNVVENSSDKKNPSQKTINQHPIGRTNVERSTKDTVPSAAFNDDTNLEDQPRKRGLGLKSSRKADTELTHNETVQKKSKIHEDEISH